MSSTDPLEESGKKKSKLIPIIIIVALAAIGGGFYWYKHSKAEEQAALTNTSTKTAIYQSLDPSFVLNLADMEQSRYLQVEISVMAHDQDVIDSIRLHMPRIRNQLLLLFSQQRYDDLRSRAARERLQGQCLAEVQKILKSETGKPGIDALYFTVFVTQ